MVVLLESGAALALGQNDSRVKDLVELGEVEPPAPESKTLVPDSANIRLVWQATRAYKNIRVQAAPDIVGVVVGDSVAESAGTVDLAKCVNGTDNGVGLAVVGERVLEAADHGDASNGRVDSQEDIVEDDKGVEWAGFGDPPRLVTVLAVVPVDIGDGDEVDGGNGQGHLVRQRALVDVFGDRERVRKRRLASPWGRNGQGSGIGRELQNSPRRPVAGVERGACTRHGRCSGGREDARLLAALGRGWVLFARQAQSRCGGVKGSGDRWALTSRNHRKKPSRYAALDSKNRPADFWASLSSAQILDSCVVVAGQARDAQSDYTNLSAHEPRARRTSYICRTRAQICSERGQIQQRCVGQGARSSRQRL